GPGPSAARCRYARPTPTPARASTATTRATCPTRGARSRSTRSRSAASSPCAAARRRASRSPARSASEHRLDQPRAGLGEWRAPRGVELLHRRRARGRHAERARETDPVDLGRRERGEGARRRPGLRDLRARELDLEDAVAAVREQDDERVEALARERPE